MRYAVCSQCAESPCKYYALLRKSSLTPHSPNMYVLMTMTQAQGMNRVFLFRVIRFDQTSTVSKHTIGKQGTHLYNILPTFQTPVQEGRPLYCRQNKGPEYSLLKAAQRREIYLCWPSIAVYNSLQLHNSFANSK